MDEERRHRARARLEVVDAVLWAAEHGAELAAIVAASADRKAARQALTAPPYGFTEFQAEHILDVPFAWLSQLGVANLRDERATLLAELDEP